MRFLYKAKNEKGAMVTGTVRAENQYEAEKLLINHGFIPIELVAEKKSLLPFSFRLKIKSKDKAIFTRQLATMISSGLPLNKAISIILSQTKKEQLKNIFQTIYKDIEEGSNFSAALTKHPEMFDRVYISVVHSGETTGKLDNVLTQLAKQLENDTGFAAKVRGALYYPAVIFAGLIAVSVYMIAVVIPKLKSIFDQAGAKLPLATRALLALSDFIIHFWYLAIIIAIILAVVFKIWLSSNSGLYTISYLQLKLPGVKQLVEGIYISRFARTMEMLISAGVPLLNSLRTSAALMKNQFYEQGIIYLSGRVEKGIPLSVELLKNPVFPPIMGQMVAVGEETGQLDKVLARVAEYYEDDVSTRIKTLSTLIEPVVLIIMGLGVAFLVFAILVPIYNIAQLQ